LFLYIFVPNYNLYTILKANQQNNYILKKWHIIALAILILPLLPTACSTKKNTRTTRAYHNLTSRYNVYFNGNESLKSGQLKLKKTYKEDYSKILPIFRYEDKEVANFVASEMDRTIKKCAKTIKVHSITVKPKTNKKKLTREEQAFMAKAEYCKWIDNAYLLMGKAHFYKRELETAKQTFLLVINKYKSEDSKYQAMLWLAKTYVELREFKNAENVLIDLRKVKKYDREYKLQMDLLNASMFMKQKKYTKAANKLKLATENEKKKKEKTRHLFILAQIYQFNEKYKLAEEHYKIVIKRNPNYDMTFMAKINLAEIFEKSGGDAKELKKQLKKMANDDKNIDYLDQIYYALGKIELNEKNDEKAIEYFTLSAQASSSNKTQKVKTYLALADYYYSKSNYKLAEPYYDSTSTSIESSFPDYERLYPQISSRKELTHNLNVVVTEDSLQFMAKMPENDRNRIVDGIIQKIVKEERAQLELANTNKGFDPFEDINPTRNTNPVQGGKYYFYNPSTISLGMTEFKKRWGDRRLSDNWRRSNKQIVSEENEVPDENKENNEESDSVKNEETKVTNVKSREYYLQNLPMTEEKLAASNKKIEDALFNAGKIYYKEMNEVEKALKEFDKLLNRFPDSEYRLEVLYMIYTIHSKDLNYTKAETYKSMIISEFPESVYAKILKDPAFVAKLIEDEKKAEKVYQQAYDKFKSKNYNQAIDIAKQGSNEFKDNELAPNFVYLTAVSYGEMGNKTALKNNLELLVLNYPEAEVSKTAKATLEAMETKKYEKELYTFNAEMTHFYILVFPHGKTDLNKLKFKYKALNLEHYTQEDLQVEVEPLDPARDILVVKQFKNAEKAKEYFQLTIINAVLNDIRNLVPSHFVISTDNFETFLKNKDEGKYLKFFNENYLVN
jgi:tetratricopeptide (TPR) repeat protein